MLHAHEVGNDENFSPTSRRTGDVLSHAWTAVPWTARDREIRFCGVLSLSNDSAVLDGCRG